MRVLQNSFRTDVTSLLIYDNYILSGMGGVLSLFRIDSSELLTQLVVFQKSRIHGLCKGSSNYIIVYGGRNISVICCNSELLHEFSILTSWKVDDWIQSVQWLQDFNIAVATSHNIVLLWNWQKGEQVLAAHCEEICILYSATFVGDTWDQLVLLSGTVFREVVIWVPAEASKTNLRAPVLQRLQGHKGVIFSIYYNSANGQIHTTSDDRSVKGWQVRSSHTGDWKLCKIDLLYTLYGHTARVWKSVRLRNFTISIGEDSQVCVWSPEGTLVKQWSVHQGGNIWSLACSEEKNVMVTGGSDGAINIFSLDSCSKNQEPVFNIPLYAWCSLESMEKCIPRRIVILKSGHLVTILESGHLICCQAGQNDLKRESAFSETKEVTDDIFTVSGLGVKSLPWVVTYYNPKLASYCLLEVSLCRQFIALASLQGEVLIFKDTTGCQDDLSLSKIIDVPVAEGKIYSLQWLSSTSVIICERDGKLTLWCMETLQDLSHRLMKMKTFILPFSKERWVTSALMYDNFLVCGDRLGSIHLYSLESNKTEAPCQTLPKVHGRLGVSSFLLHDQLIYSTGRDGTLRQYEMLKRDNKLQLLCATSMLFDWVTSVCVYANDILVLGFSEKKFVVWSQQQQRLVFETLCGGGHRSWDYFVKENILTFVCIQHKCLCCSFFDLIKSLKPLLQAGFHPKEVNCVQKLQMISKSPLFISGGEDTTLRLTTINSQSKFHTLVVLRSHISSVKAISCHFKEDKIFIFSAGGRAQMKAWEIRIENMSDITTSSPMCRELCSHMLMEYYYKQNKSWKDFQRNIDPETRYMCLCIVPHDQIFVVVGCSDGYLRLFQFDVHQLEFQFVQSFDFHHRCILNVAAIASSKIITMATDGILAFWDLSSIINDHLFLRQTENKKQEETSPLIALEPYSFFKIHQCGINCFALEMMASNHVLIATGGDDSALVLSVFKFLDKPNSAYLVQQWRMESAHVAQITGMCFIDSYLVSASVDQHIFIWKWIYEVNHQLLFVNKVAKYFSIVSDIHGLNVWRTGHDISLCVFGKGFEIIDVLSVSNEDGKVL